MSVSGSVKSLGAGAQAEGSVVNVSAKAIVGDASAEASGTLGQVSATYDGELSIDGKVVDAGASIKAGGDAKVGVSNTGKLSISGKISILKGQVSVNLNNLAEATAGVLEAVATAITPDKYFENPNEKSK